MRPTSPIRRLELLGLALAGALAVAVVGGVAGSACAPAGFDSATKIESVRILASRVDDDKSYARPGDTVTLEALTVDGRANPTPPAALYWIPYLCENPLDDLYYACFAPQATADAGLGSGDGGAGAGIPGLGAILQPGRDLTPFLPTGPYTLTVPGDIIANHPPVNGATPYGLVIVFNIACAGQVRWAGLANGGGPQQVPLLCTDANGTPLGPDDYVIGFTRVYVYDTQTNVNPEVDGILLGGLETKTQVQGTALPPQVNVTLPACRGGCSGVALDMDVPASSWAPKHKSLWVDYYALGGSVDSEARLLYDVNAGKVSDTKNPAHYFPPDQPGTATLWAVVHDANDGATWLQVNVTAQ